MEATKPQDEQTVSQPTSTDVDVTGRAEHTKSTIVQMASFVDVNATNVVCEASVDALNIAAETTQMAVRNVNTMEMNISTNGLPPGVSIEKADCVQINLISPDDRKPILRKNSEAIESNVFDPNMDKIFVETDSYHLAKDILEKHRLVIISGGIGEGKTFLANKLASEKIQEGYILKTFDSCLKVRNDEKSIFLLDNIFTKSPRYGQNTANVDTLLKTTQRYSEIDQESGHYFYVIVTARPHVLNELQDDISIPVFQKQEYIVNLAVGLSHKDKVEMFRKHESCLTKSDYVDDDIVEQICKCNCPSFPICVKLFFQQDNLFLKGLRFFQNPFQVIQSDVHRLYKDDREVYAFLVMLILNDGEIDECTFGCFANVDPLQKLLRCEKDEINQRMNECVGRIPSTYIRHENEKIKIQHDCIFHAICISFSKILPTACLMHLSFDFITQTIRIQTENFETLDDENICLKRNCFPSLAQRFLTEIEDGNIQLVVQHQAMSDPIFLAVFSDILQRIENTSGFLRILQSTERDKSHESLWNGTLLYWSASLGNRNLFSKLIVKNFYKKVAVVDDYFVRTQASATLSNALWGGLLKINHIELLLDLGAEVNSAIQKQRRMQSYSCDFCITRDINGATVLQAAIFGDGKNNVDLVQILLEKGARLNKNVFPNTLIRIVQKGDCELVKLLLENHKDIKGINFVGHSPLWYAVEANDHRTAKLLAQNYTGQNHKETIFNSVQHLDVANMLQTFGVDTNATDDSGRNSLHGIRNADLVHYLVENGAPVDGADNFGRTPLFYSKTPATADALLQHEADFTKVDKDGKNIFHFLQDIDVIEKIISSIDEHNRRRILNQKDNSGQTPLFYCSSDDNLEKLKILVTFGASINVTSSKNDLRKSYTAENNSSQDDEEIGDYIYSIEYPSDELIGEQKFSNLTTRQIYVQNWIAFTCKILFLPLCIKDLSSDIDEPSSAIMNASDSHGKHSERIADSETNESQHGYEMTSLPVPVKKGSTVGMNLILCGKFDIGAMETLDEFNFKWEATNDVGETVLHYLLSPQYEGNNNNVGNLFQKIITSVNRTSFVNSQDGNKNTPLHLACLCRITNRLESKDRFRVIQTLLQNDADANIVNAWNQTPLHCLLNCRCSSFDFVRLLISKTSTENINLSSKSGMQPLQCLLSIPESDEGFLNDTKASLEILFEHGADLEKCLSNYGFCAKLVNPSLFDIILQKFKSRMSSQLIKGIIEQCVQLHEITNSWAIMAVISEHFDIKSDDVFGRINKDNWIPQVSVLKHKVVKQCCQNVHRTHIIKVLTFIFQSNEDINQPDDKGKSYLLKVVKYYRGDYCDLVKILLMLMKKGADSNCRNIKGKTAIQRLILGNGPDYYIVKCLHVLAEYGAIIDNGHPLIWAAKSNKLRTKVIQFLPDTVSPDDEDEIGNAFHYLIKSYARGVDLNLTSIDALYRKGVEINSKNISGETPLHLSVRFSVRKDIMIELLNYYADVNRPNNEGLTPLHYILLYLDVHEIFAFKEFLKYDGDLSLTDGQGRTYLHYAVVVMRPATLKILSIILRKRVCDINAKDNKGNSVIHAACFINCRPELRHTQSMTDDVNSVCDDEWCASLRVHVVRVLINSNADINVISDCGQTILHSLVLQYHAFKQHKQRQCLKYLHSIIDMIYLIVLRGIDIDIKDIYGKTAINYLTEYSLTSLEDLIERKISPEALKDKLTSGTDAIETSRITDK